ncbi:MAG: lipid-A-disaccharide synthase-related protein [Oscillatoria sp. PMC 1068.18]|nr:lipid-A-disaccharide synthase-related protein [Oscillatoria sp. PMC 1076.18]MEC4989551.1 lipid-A-disaccharide synthase-related protein [Oscillatoria sp. PMC 1068.18]
MKLLCLSNGHGEDVIAVRILEQLQQQNPAIELAALPLVGEGYAYTKLAIPIIGKVQKMPSGGFVYMDNRQLLRDVKGGLLKLLLAQYKVVRRWNKSGGKILAVGDIVPLLLAWLSGADYAFVGTAKSEYYLRDEAGWYPKTSRWERFSGSVYYPWERWLMKRKRCQGVFPRDFLTTETLQSFQVQAFALGNPMMDEILPGNSAPVFYERNSEERELGRSLKVLLLPGSRDPEAYQNWELILQAISGVMVTFRERSPVFLAAIAPNLDLTQLQQILLASGWISKPLSLLENPLSDPEALGFSQKNATLLLTQNAYSESLLAADVAIAMSGTATEQFVGLGKPAIAIPGKGPQYTYAFAEAQTRLLGPSLTLVKNPERVANSIQAILTDPDRIQLIAENGQQRLGEPGAAVRIANFLSENLLRN